MNDNGQKRLAEESIQEIAAFFKLNGEDIFKFDQRTRYLIILGFQAGIGFWQMKNEQIVNEAETLLKDMEGKGK